ncbi:hypothetical protein H9M94_00385 [Mycoplasma sp. Pen4]|uniref:hypothetical protein n=1 Tax=Mycoplasma sp. Pen4 TaxID=640330 RepID=UPI0016544AD2|nr:hypothetical protein [Mycoplasma sp. Pen4]QNM93723.1 hypothetical protein H9M94_00385 [Mycoplasma sp. Pen4]
MHSIKEKFRRLTYSAQYDWIFLIIFFIIGAILASLSFINYGIFLGFAIGSLLIYVFFKLNWLISYFVLRSKKTKLYAIFILKSALYFGLLAAVIFSTYAINKMYLDNPNNYHFSDVFNKPINIFGMVGGISIGFLTLIVHEIIKRSWVDKKL